MENKKTFGVYTCRHRRELGLARREFADRFSVTGSAVNKWERGMSYPDITLVRDIYAILQVSEYELPAANGDVEACTVETLAKKYLSLLRRLCRVQYIPYGGTVLICLICNLAVGYTLDWFRLVLTGELVGTSLALLPILVKQHQGVVALRGFTLSLGLLLLAACLFSGGDWFLLALAGVSLGPGAAFLPGALRELSRPLGEHRVVLYLGTETLLLCTLFWVSCTYDGGNQFPIPTLPATLLGLILLQAWVPVCRYAPASRRWRGTACLGAAYVFLPLVSPVIDWSVRLGGRMVEWLHGFWFRPDFTR